MTNFKTFFRTAAFLAALVSLAFLPGCENDDDDHEEAPDTENPQFVITSPSDMQIYFSGDTVFLQGTLTDTGSRLHELEIKIKDTATDSTLYSKIQSVHDLETYAIDFFWKSSVSDHTNAIVIFSAEDHAENVGTDTVQIHIMP